VDHCFSSRVFFGGGASYSATFLDWKESRGDGHIHEILGGLYASYVDQRFFVNLTALAGVNLYDLHRRIKFSTISRTAESSSYGYEISPHVAVGVNLLPERFSTALQLFGDADYFYFNRKRFQEFGAQSLNLDVRTKTSNMMRSEVGARLNHTVTKQGGCFAPYIGLSWVGKYHLSSGSYNASLDQVPRIFTVFSFDKNIFFISPEAGLQITLKDGFSFSADYKGEFGHYGHVNKVDLRLNWLY
jgi:outer membrane autotransporter protein